MSRSYSAVQVTLTTSGTAYSLATLARAIDADIPGECRQLTIEADRANTAGSTVSVGDASISSTRYGYQLAPGDTRVYDDPGGLVRLAQIYFVPSANGLKVNVEVMA